MKRPFQNSPAATAKDTIIITSEEQEIMQMEMHPPIRPQCPPRRSPLLWLYLFVLCCISNIPTTSAFTTTTTQSFAATNRHHHHRGYRGERGGRYLVAKDASSSPDKASITAETAVPKKVKKKATKAKKKSVKVKGVTKSSAEASEKKSTKKSPKKSSKTTDDVTSSKNDDLSIKTTTDDVSSSNSNSNEESSPPPQPRWHNPRWQDKDTAKAKANPAANNSRKFSNQSTDETTDVSSNSNSNSNQESSPPPQPQRQNKASSNTNANPTSNANANPPRRKVIYGGYQNKNNFQSRSQNNGYQSNGYQQRGNNNNNNNNRGYQQGNTNMNQAAMSRNLNQQLVQCESAKDLLMLLQNQKGSLTSPSGGGKLNSVNFSTSIHRIARHLNQMNYQRNNQGQNNQNNNPQQNDARYNRAVILSDPRFALLLCSLAEALGGMPYDATNKRRTTVSFGSRELSNIAWALAKMKIAPPQSASPLLSTNNYKVLLLNTAKQLREKVVEVAKAKTQQQQSTSEAEDANLWIPTLSLLCGHILDTIGLTVTDTEGENSGIMTKNPFQERANLIWALATSQRGNVEMFDGIINPMIDEMERQLWSSNQEDDAEKHPQQQQEKSPLQPQEWSNSVWAFATSQTFGRGQVRLIQFIAKALETCPQFPGMFKPQELSNTAWGVATLLSKKKSGVLEDGEQEAAITILRHVARAVSGRAAEFKTQELSNTLWAFATLGFGISTSSSSFAETNSLNDYVVLTSNDPEQDEKLVRKATDAILEESLPRLHRFRSQELNNVAWGLARMGRRDTVPVLREIGRQLAVERRKVSSQDIATSLWSFATLEFFDEDVYRRIAARLQVNRARYSKPQELSNTIWAMATAELTPRYPDIFDTVLVPPKQRFSGPVGAIDDPITLWFGVAAEELLRRPFEFKSQEIKDTLWSFSKIGIRHPELFKGVAVHLVGGDPDPTKGNRNGVRGLDDFSPQGLGNTAWAFARQAQLVEDVSKRVDLTATVLTNTGKMSVYATSFFDIGEILVQRLFGAIAEADLRVHDNLSGLKPQDISNTAWAMAVLGMKHVPFLEAANEQLVERANENSRGRRNLMTLFKGQEIANLLWAFAILNVPVRGFGSDIGPYMVREVTKSTEDMKAEGIARIYKRMELANVAWSSAVFGEFPPDLMELLYCGLVGTGEKSGKEHLRQCFNDGGLQQSAIMSLIYLQLALELEKKDKGLYLPEQFPDGWKQESSSRKTSNDLDDMTFELRLSTSKIQRDVSAAFQRIGFNHVLEHVISLDELLDNQGVALASSIEVISIDIADLESRIAVEVDGPPHFLFDIENIPAKGGYSTVKKGRMEYSFEMSSGRNPINGPTALKKRMLGQMGWKTINIPFWEWYDLNSNERLEEEYCRRLLEEVKNDN